MPNQCVLIHCKNSQKEKNGKDISFHSFPTNELLRNEWISIIKKSRKDDNWLPPKHGGVCTVHFKKEDVYTIPNGRRCIRKNALPTLCLSASRTMSDTSEGLLSCPVETKSFEIVTMAENEQPPETPEIIEVNPEINLNEELPLETDDSDLDSLFDSPIESHVRKVLRKKQKLTANHEQKIKILYEEIKALEEKNLSLKSELKKLRKKKNRKRNNKILTKYI